MSIKILGPTGGEFGSNWGDKPVEFALQSSHNSAIIWENMAKTYFAMENQIYLFSTTLTSGAEPFDFSSDETFLFLASPIFIKI